MTTSSSHSTKTARAAKHTPGAPATAPVPAPDPASASSTEAAPSPPPAAHDLSFASPPPISAIPVAPAGSRAGSAAPRRGVLPIQEEMDDLDAAIKDLAKIPNYALFVGAPPLAQVTQILALAGEWTRVRNASHNFDLYAATEEGNVWGSARPILDEFRGAFAQAQKADPTLATLLPGLVKFLGVRSAVAQRGVSTKRANKKAEADGKPPQHGQVGKKRKRAAERDALATAEANGSSGATTAKGAATVTPAPEGKTTTNGTATS